MSKFEKLTNCRFNNVVFIGFSVVTLVWPSEISLRKEFPPVMKVDASKAVVIRGVISRIECPQCDTVIDTVYFHQIDSKHDTTSFNYLQKRIRELEIRRRDLDIIAYKKEGTFFEECSCAARKRVVYPPCEFFVSLTDTFALPAEVEQISFVIPYEEDRYLGKGSSRCSTAVKRFLGQKCTMCSIWDQRSTKMRVKALSYFPYTFLCNPDSNSEYYSLRSRVNYCSLASNPHPGIDYKLELFKDLIRIDRTRFSFNKIQLVKNLMYNQIYLRHPEYFSKMVEANLPEVRSQIRREIVAEQEEVARKYMHDAK